LNIFATITFRVYVKNALKGYEPIYQTLCGDVGSVILSNLISILIYLVYDFMVKWQTKFEVHRTQSEYEKAITLKIFVLEFANEYFPLIYVAFFRQITWENGYFDLGKKYQDTCDANTCMTLLSLQVFVSLLFSGLARFFKTFLVHALKR
jgi:anoctamin-7